MLTLVKAYYIAGTYDLGMRKSALRRANYWTPIFLVAYLDFYTSIGSRYIYNSIGTVLLRWELLTNNTAKTV